MAEIITRWDIFWGQTAKELAAQYERDGDVRYRKDGGYDRRFAVSRFVKRVRDGNIDEAIRLA